MLPCARTSGPRVTSVRNAPHGEQGILVTHSVRALPLRQWLRPRRGGTAAAEAVGAAARPATGVVAWFAINLATNATRLLDFSPNLYVGVEAASSFARLFGALVLFLAADDRERPRLRWIAASFLVLGFGGLVFGYLPPTLHHHVSTNSALYASRFVWTAAGSLILVGLVPREPLPFRPRLLGLGAAAVVAALAVLVALPVRLPTLVRDADLSREVARNRLVLDGMTGWHWLVSVIPLALVLLAVATLVRRGTGDVLDGRLLVAMVLFAGAQLHDVLWPSAYGPVLTASDVLEFVFAGAVAVAGVVELRRVGDERAWLLARERELAMLKNDFTAMIAHELGNPLTAIRRQADLIARGRLEGETRDRALEAIQAEAKLLTQL